MEKLAELDELELGIFLRQHAFPQHVEPFLVAVEGVPVDLVVGLERVLLGRRRTVLVEEILGARDQMGLVPVETGFEGGGEAEIVVRVTPVAQLAGAPRITARRRASMTTRSGVASSRGG